MLCSAVSDADVERTLGPGFLSWIDRENCMLEYSTPGFDDPGSVSAADYTNSVTLLLVRQTRREFQDAEAQVPIAGPNVVNAASAPPDSSRKPRAR